MDKVQKKRKDVTLWNRLIKIQEKLSVEEYLSEKL